MKRTRIISVILALTMLLGLLPGAFVISANAITGFGTASNPYIVTTWDEFDSVMRLEDPGPIYVNIGNDISWVGDDKYYSTAIPVNGNIVLDLKGHFIHKYCKGTHGDIGGTLDYHWDGAGYGKILAVAGTLVINDTVGGGTMQVNGELVEEYYWQTNSYDCHEQVLIADYGGRLTVNGGNYIAGYTKEMYCAAAYVAKSEGRNVSYLDSDYNGDAWRVDSGTALTAKNGSTVIIRGGTFTGIGYADLGCEDSNGWGLQIWEKQAALEINSGANVKIYNGNFHGDGGANIINYNGGNVEVWCAAFTVKSPRIIVGDRWNQTLTKYRIEYDTSKSPGKVNIPTECFKGAENGGVFHYDTTVIDYAPGRTGDFGYGPLEPLPEPDLNVYFEDPAVNSAGKIEWAPYSSRVIRADSPNYYYPAGAGMYAGQELYYNESTYINMIANGYGWTIYDVNNPASFKTINTFRDDFDLNWFCTGYNSVFVEQSAGFTFQKGHTYAVKYRPFIAFNRRTTYVCGVFCELTQKVYVPDVSLPFVEYSSFTNMWSRPVGGKNNYQLTLFVRDLDRTMNNTVELRLVKGDGESSYSVPVIGDDGGVVTFSLTQYNSTYVRFTDAENMLKPGAMNKLALHIFSQNPSSGARYETEFAFDVYCPKWVTTDRYNTDEQDEMDHMTTVVRCVGSDKVTLKHNNTSASGTKYSCWKFTPASGGDTVIYKTSNNTGSNLTLGASDAGIYQYFAYSDSAGTKLIYSSNQIRVMKSDCYYIHFDAGDGTGDKPDVSVSAGGTYTAPNCVFIPPEDKKFLFWRCEGERYYPGDTITVEQDLVFTAIYVQQFVTLSFDPGEGSGYMESVVVPNWVDYELPECTFTPPSGRRFSGYWLDSRGYYYRPGFAYTPYVSETFTPYWTPAMCTITFDRNGGRTDMDPGTALYGTQYTLPNCTAQPPAGLTFDSYIIDGTYGFMPGTKIDVTGDMTIVINWTYPKVLTTAGCTIGAPVAGEHPDMNPVSLEPEKYDVIVEEWKNYKTQVEIGENEKFTKDFDYQVVIIFAPKSGYAFEKGNTVFEINGQTATNRGSTSMGFYEALTMAANSETTITNAGATIDEPHKGMTPAEINATIQSNNPYKYTVSVHHWTYVAEGSLITMRTDVDTFKPGVEYTPYLVFTPLDEYSFNNDTIYTLNGGLTPKDPYYEWCSGVKFIVDAPQSGDVSGGITNRTDQSEPVTISLYKSGSDYAAYSITIPGDSMSYAVCGVAPGNYTLIASSQDKTLATKFITVDGSITCDLVLKLFMRGDFDFDGQITVADALAALRIAAKLVTETYDHVQIGDIDGDGHVTVADALSILRVAAKLTDISTLG
ncbi:MAG: dockerin type I repeat-containing protein [Clostridia bacterium]|nr:dockerin type I repeat-containing protein [Clostridia bacterium]